MTLPPSRFDWGAPVPALEELGRTHLVAIGGAGMSGVARVLLQAGLPVSGSDAQESPVLAALADEGAQVWVGHDPAHVEGADTVVVSSAIRDSNPELVAARAVGLQVLHRSQALAAAMRSGGASTVAVAGANGKTTTTSLLVVALEAAGADPSFVLGGTLSSAGTNARLGRRTGARDGVFVVEADESDGSFLVYRPDVAVVTSVQPDHLDHYGDLATVKEAYRAFVDTIAPSGVLVVCVDDPAAVELVAPARARGLRVVGYGESPAADLRIVDAVSRGLTSRARLEYDAPGGPTCVELALLVPGRHNLQNAAAAYAVTVLGLDREPSAVLEGLASYSGTRRRFEPRGTAGGVQVVDDYAHNPGKLAAVVATARGLVDEGNGSGAGDGSDDGGSPGRLVVLFQPHLYSRTRDFAPELGAALRPADVVVVMDVYAAREDPWPGVSGRLVADAVTEQPDAVAAGDEDSGRAGRPTVHFVPSRQDVVPLLLRTLRPGDLLLTVGAGDVTTVGPEVLRALEIKDDRSTETTGGQA